MFFTTLLRCVINTEFETLFRCHLFTDVMQYAVIVNILSIKACDEKHF